MEARDGAGVVNEDLVIVFVDALPYEALPLLVRSRRALSWHRPLQPGFGYSINVKSELFAGLVPDAVGFLNEWTYRPRSGAGWVGAPRWLWRHVNRSRVVRRGVTKVLSRLVKEDLRNIPLPLLPAMVRTGANAYERGYERETLFSRHGVTRYVYTEHGGDDGAYRALRRAIESSPGPIRAFLAQCELDHVTHKYGKGTREYRAMIDRIDTRLAELWEVLRARGAGRLCLVSDHGMANVERHVTFDIAEAIGGAGERYGYFVDATMARVWSDDESVLVSVQAWLVGQRLPGRVLSPEERSRWGISTPAFGQLVFLLDEGAMFVPNFFGDRPCKAMHGYWPSLSSQRGLLAASVPLNDCEEHETVTAIQAHHSLSRCAAMSC